MLYKIAAFLGTTVDYLN
ncbi:hypothetical protein QJ133_14860 [Priestia megaterium]|nr:hypothetical protein [Priestia megaterium]MDI3092402.1 hypothetical protein [Priestia megaterium]